jgi:hypothetical protein
MTANVPVPVLRVNVEENNKKIEGLLFERERERVNEFEVVVNDLFQTFFERMYYW